MNNMYVCMIFTSHHESRWAAETVNKVWKQMCADECYQV